MIGLDEWICESVAKRNTGKYDGSNRKFTALSVYPYPKRKDIMEWIDRNGIDVVDLGDDYSWKNWKDIRNHMGEDIALIGRNIYSKSIILCSEKEPDKAFRFTFIVSFDEIYEAIDEAIQYERTSTSVAERQVTVQQLIRAINSAYSSVSESCCTDDSDRVSESVASGKNRGRRKKNIYYQNDRIDEKDLLEFIEDLDLDVIESLTKVRSDAKFYLSNMGSGKVFIEYYTFTHKYMIFLKNIDTSIVFYFHSNGGNFNVAEICSENTNYKANAVKSRTCYSTSEAIIILNELIKKSIENQ